MVRVAPVNIHVTLDPHFPPASCAHTVVAMSFITRSSIAARRVAHNPEARGAKKFFLMVLLIVVYCLIIFLSSKYAHKKLYGLACPKGKPSRA